MRNALTVFLTVLLFGCATSANKGALEPRSGLSATETSGELQVEIHSPSTDFSSIDGETTVEVEGMASTIGGVRSLDLMLVLDTSTSLRRTDPDNFRSTGAIGLIESLSSKSDLQIGVVSFDSEAELVLPLTSDRGEVVRTLGDMQRSGGTDLAAGIHAALDEFEKNARLGSSRVILMFTDGQSSRRKAREAARKAQSDGVTIQSLLLGSSKKGASILEEIALGTGGNFVQVEDPSKLPEAFQSLRTTGVDYVTLSVNGSEPVPARLAGGTFTGSVPLELGENRIVAMATSLDAQTRESVITVNVRDASCATLEVAALSAGRSALSLDERAIEIIVDASRSMWGQMDGQPKMAVAKEILQDVSSWLPDDLDLALRAYGNASPSGLNDCSDSALLVPFGEENRQPISDAISKLRPLGQTPIAYALHQAAGDFDGLQSDRTLVLVTDGIESCGGDPVAAARELREQGIMIHLIGFGLSNTADEDAASLQAVADASGGRFITASSAEELKEALEVTVGTRFRVFKEDTVVANGSLGSDEPLLLPEGDYRVQLESVPPHEVEISLAPRDELTLTLEKEAGAVSYFEQRGRGQYTACEDGVTTTDRPQVSEGLNRPVTTTPTVQSTGEAGQ
jgi:Mg-chelatase subunit ChlD